MAKNCCSLQEQAQSGDLKIDEILVEVRSGKERVETYLWWQCVCGIIQKDKYTRKSIDIDIPLFCLITPG